MEALEEELRCLRDSGMTSWDLTGNEMGDNGVKVVINALRQNGRVRSVDFSKNKIGDEGVKCIADLLKVNTVLHGISLRSNCFGDEGLVALTDVLATSPSIWEVNFSGNPISDNGARAIAKMLRTNTVIQEVDLNDCQISDTGVKAIADALRVRPTIPKIKLESPFMDIKSVGKDAQVMKLLNSARVQEALKKTARDGEAPLQRSRLVLVGEAHSGKTSTLHALLGDSFDLHEMPTEGATICHCDGHPLGAYDFWPVKRDVSREERELWAAAAMAEIEDPSTLATDSAAPSGSALVGDIELARCLQNEVDGDKRPLRVAVWDCGGHQVFCDMHYAFLTQYSVYLLVFNLETLRPKPTSTWKPTKRWRSGDTENLEARQVQGLQALRSWLQMIQLHSPDAPIILVGTHKDKVSSVSQYQHIDAILRHSFHFEPDSGDKTVPMPNIIHNETDNLCFFPVDNVQGPKDDMVKQLRDVIRVTIVTQEFNDQNASVKCLQLLDALGSSGRPFLPFDVVEVIAATEVQMTLGELTSALSKFHQFGLLFWWQSTALHDFVVLDLQWLVDGIMRFLRDARKMRKQTNVPSTLKDIDKLQSQGLLTNDLLQVILPPSLYDEASQAFLLDLLQKLCFLCEWPSGHPQWFLPALITVNQPLLPSSQLWHKSQTILVDFRSSFIPPGFFMQLVCCLAQLQVRQMKQTQGQLTQPPPMVNPTDAWLNLDGTDFHLELDGPQSCIRCEVVLQLQRPCESNHKVLEHLRNALQQLVSQCAPNLQYSIQLPSSLETLDANGRPLYCSPEELESGSCDEGFAHWSSATPSGFTEEQARSQIERLVQDAPDQARHVMQPDNDVYNKLWRHTTKFSTQDLKDLNKMVEELKGLCAVEEQNVRQPLFGMGSTSVSNLDYLDCLYDACANGRQAFEQRIQTVVSKVAAVTFHPSPAKTVPRTLEKAYFKYGGDLARVCDILRCKVVAKEMFSVVQMLRRLLLELRASSDGFRIASMNCKFTEDFHIGKDTCMYRDVTILLFVPNGDGLLAELKIHLKAFDDAQQEIMNNPANNSAGRDRHILCRHIMERLAFEKLRLGEGISAEATSSAPTITEESNADPESEPSPAASPKMSRKSSGSNIRSYLSNKLHLSRKPR